MLALWPIVIVILFTRLPLPKAFIWSVLVSYLALPVGTRFDFTGFPSLDKTSIPNISMMICVIFLARRKKLLLPDSKLARFLILTFIFSPILSSMGNADYLVLEYTSLPPMTLYDALSICFGQAIALIPFILGYSLCREDSTRDYLVVAVGLAGLAYSLPMLLEIRLSPQLHYWIYGFFPHSFGQQMRGSGFRPVVFLGHGLLVATFAVMALLAMVAMMRKRRRLVGTPAGLLVVYLGVVLLLCKSVGAIFLAAVFAPLLARLRARQLITITGVLAIIIVAYPMLRGSGIFPRTTVVKIASLVSDERSQSISYRFDNEDILLKKANERPIFGWGGWGRNRVYETGYQVDRDISVTDGTWIIVAGMFGWIGYLSCFGLLTYPLIAASGRRFPFRFEDEMTRAALSVVLIVNLLDLIPNSSLTPLTWLLAGALFRQAQPRERDEESDRAELPLPQRRGSTSANNALSNLRADSAAP